MNTPVVILGCRPGPALDRRLEAALPHITGNVVVTGYGEASYMRDWLLARGIPDEAIIVEEHATSTNENLERVYGLLGGGGWIVVTNTYHLPRVRMWAWHHKIPIRVVGAPTPRNVLAKHLLREVLAFSHSIARVVWRRWCWYQRGR
ncbi:MAG: YdcF family protein [Corynebacterium sp.]|nr:YdcF family protein [Corynebacterium sp.]